MGSSRWDASDWGSYQSTTQSKTQQQIFTSKAINPALNPNSISVRESVDSEANPNSTPVIVAVDVTGSMGILAENIVRKGLGVIMQEIYDRKPIPDPHVLCAAIGDGFCDTAPLQVTQFEASIVLAEQVEKLWLEGGGGGNGGESYLAAWYFAAMKTKCDSMMKRNKKGYLFTIGDEPPHLTLTKDQIKSIFGDDVEKDYSAKDLLAAASQLWEVFHLIVNPGGYDASSWATLLGERSIKVTDHQKLAEVIVSTIEIIEGRDVNAVVSSWSGDTSLVVSTAVNGLTKSGAGTGVVRF